MSASNVMKGVRLEFYAQPLKGKLKRKIHKYEDKRIIEQEIEEAAGYMLYTANGSVLRLSGAELAKRGYDRVPKVMNLEKARDPNSPGGKYQFGLTEAIRKEGYSELVSELIKFCTKRSGPVVDKKGEIHDSAAA